jgi:metal-responsive CopG/Arc/MetJ family transcriptional regulator
MAKVEFEKSLWARVVAFAAAEGYSSPEEFVQHAVERAVSESDSGEGEDGAKKLKGIGYLDAGLDI